MWLKAKGWHLVNQGTWLKALGYTVPHHLKMV